MAFKYEALLGLIQLLEHAVPIPNLHNKLIL